MSAARYAAALAACQAGDMVLCAALAAQILTDEPDHGPALLLRAVSCPSDQPARAIALHAAACRKAPHDAEAWFNYGVALESRSLLTPAMAAYRRAIALDPMHFGALLNGTQMIRVHEHFEEALVLARRLQQFDPDHPAGYTHEAISLQHLGQLEESDAAFAEAVGRSAEPELLHWEHHFSLLQREQFEPAWAAYETRFACGRFNGVEDMAFALPRWQGAAGEHVLVYGEQGIGDQLMFAAALPDLAARAGKVSLALAPALVDLFAASFPDIAILPIERGGDPDECAAVAAAAGSERPVDSVLAIGSLMTHFRNARSDFTGKPYLRPSDAARAFWRKRARRGEAAGLRVGLCWASNPAPDRFFSARRAVHKTMPLAVMARLAEAADATFVAVTNVPLDRESDPSGRAAAIADVSADLVSLDRTAALLETLDLLITVDTGVAHLAGALGVPVWVLLHRAGDARWGRHGATACYWYDSAELLWQDRQGDWDAVIDTVAARLAALAAPARRGKARRAS